jgi:hypothetical protein
MRKGLNKVAPIALNGTTCESLTARLCEPIRPKIKKAASLRAAF